MAAIDSRKQQLLAQGYWLEQTSKADPRFQPFTTAPRNARGPRCSLFLSAPAGLAAAIDRTARSRPLSQFVLLAAALQLVSYRFAHRTRQLLALPDIDPSGECGSPDRLLFLATPIREDMRLCDLMTACAGDLQEALRNRDFSFPAFFEKYSALSRSGGSPLLDLALTYAPVHGPNRFLPDVQTLWCVTPTPAGFNLRIEYDSSRSHTSVIQSAGLRFLHALELLTSNPQATVESADLLLAGEPERLIAAGCGESLPVPQATIAALLESQVERSPDRPAVVSSRGSLSYRDLNVAADHLAAALRKQGVGKGDTVAMRVAPSLEMIVGMMGILKAGAAYVPVALELPVEKANFVLADCAAKVLLIDRAEELAGESLVRLPISMSIEADAAPAPVDSATPDDLAYIIYTSGSTGDPKGVAITQRAVVNLVHGLQRRIFRQPDSLRVSLLAAYVFDASVQQIFTSLLFGHTLFVIGVEDRGDPSRIVEFLADNRIEVFDGTPTMLSLMLDCGLDRRPLNDLRSLLIGGEVLPKALVSRFFECGFHPQARIFNVYGPTECCVDATCFEISADHYREQRSIPIGSALPNVAIYCLDPRMRPVPPGATGEIYIGGPGLGRGYVNNPQMTADRFVQSPFTLHERLYRTGDAGRFVADGVLDCIGRLDTQSKYHGIRFEPGEIETALERHPDVRKAIVLVTKDRHEADLLVAYYVARAEIDQIELKAFLSRQLIPNLVPNCLIHLTRVPLTTSGKLDLKALPDPERHVSSLPAFAPPGSETEALLVSVWESVFQRPGIGVDHNYYSLGGDSIKAIWIASRIFERSGGAVSVTVRQVLQHPTIRELASHATAQTTVSTSATPSGSLPLTPIQRYFFEELHDPALFTKQHFNNAVLLFSPSFDAAALYAVFTALQAHHDALRTCFIAGETIVQEVGGLDHPVSFEIVDLKGSDNEKDELARRVDAIHRSVHALSVPLMRTALFHLGDGDRLLIVIHHLVKDGVSWRILLEDLAAGYEFVRQGRPVRFPLKTDSYQRWAEALVRHSQHPALLEERDYWRNIADREAPGLPRDYDCSAGSRAANAVEHFELDAEETAALLTSVPGEFAVDINTVLLACFARALSVWSNNAWHPIWLEGHGREDIVPLNIGRTVGWFTTMFPVILEGHAGHSMEEHLRLTAQALAAIPNRGIGYGILRYLTPRELLADFPFRLQPRILFNYLGQLELPERTFRFASESPGRQVSDEMPWLVDLSLSGLVSGGKLAIGIEYSQQMYRPATVARLTSLYRENLLALLARSQQHAR